MRGALKRAVETIAAAGCDAPRLDGELLLAHVLGVTRAQLLMTPGRALGAAEAEAYGQAVSRRAHGREPLAYITGRRAFRELELAVDPRVLITRPESELLVEVALALPSGTRVLDLGTGSGAIALALAQERPDLDVSGSDISAGALELAAVNGRRLGLEVRWLRGDLLEGLDGEFDVVLANLPYVAESERAGLAPEIVRHEPPEALFAGPDGLDRIRELTVQLAAWRHVGMVALEVGEGQSRTVGELARAGGFDAVRFESDLAGIQRVVVATRRRR